MMFGSSEFDTFNAIQQYNHQQIIQESPTADGELRFERVTNNEELQYIEDQEDDLKLKNEKGNFNTKNYSPNQTNFNLGKSNCKTDHEIQGTNDSYRENSSDATAIFQADQSKERIKNHSNVRLVAETEGVLREIEKPQR